jgi:hypothetical protein
MKVQAYEIDNANTAEPAINYVAGFGPFPSGTREIEVTITTDIESSCRMHYQSGHSFSNMSTIFESTDYLVHTKQISLSGDYTANRYVRCQSKDSLISNTTDFNIQVTFANSTTITTPQDLSVSNPMSLDGQYSLDWAAISGANYYHLMEQKDAGLWRHVPSINGNQSVSLNRPELGRYQYRLSACSDATKVDCSAFSQAVVVSVGANEEHFAPVISYVSGRGPYPAEGLEIEMVVTTNVDAICRYKYNDSGVFEYWSSDFTTTDNRTHNAVVTLYDDYTQNKYIRCKAIDTGYTNTKSFVYTIHYANASVLSKPQNLKTNIPLNLDGNFNLSWDLVEGASYYHLMEQRDTERWKPVNLDSIFFSDSQTLNISLFRPIEGRYQYKISACTDIDRLNCGEFSYEAIVSVGADPTHFPPQITELAGSGPYPDDVREVEMVIATNLDALCRYKYNDSGNFSYWSGDFESQDKRLHRKKVTLYGAYNQTKYVRCQALQTGYTHNQSFPFNIYFADSNILSKPLNFVVDNASNNGQFSLSWEPVFNAQSYHLIESMNDGPWQEITIHQDNLNKTINKSSDGIYRYLVSACEDENAKRCGTFSGLVNVTVTGASDATADDDNDGVANIDDAFPNDPTEWLDTDNDGIGNNADDDDDNDGVEDIQDAFPLDPLESLDTDSDGIGNNADPDDDNDNVPDVDDSFPLDETEWFDSDGDGLGNNQDLDDDNDGVNDTEDAFPLDSTESVDTDNDGIGNNADDDDDGDGVVDSEDDFPEDPNESSDLDGDGLGNNVDTDDDNDGVIDEEDLFPLDPNEWADMDLDGVGDNADTDIDGDGIINEEDAFPLDGNEWEDTDTDGIGNNTDTDIDGDGYLNDEDVFPEDASEWLDLDGDGVGDNSDLDKDGDGYSNDNDAFPEDASEWLDLDGDGIGDNSDGDRDGDGVNNSDDAFPDDSSDWNDLDNDGIGDNADPDRDGDGYENGADFYPDDPNRNVFEPVSNLNLQLSGDKVIVNWTNGGNDNGDKLLLQRSIYGSDLFETIVELEPSNSQFEDIQVNNRTAYQYRIIGASVNGRLGEASELVNIFVAYNLDKIEMFTAMQNEEKIRLMWISLNADEYIIYRAQAGTQPTQIASVTQLEFFDENIQVGNGYSYHIINRKNFVNPINAESFYLDSEVSEQKQINVLEQLSVVVKNVEKLSEGNYRLVVADNSAISISGAFVNAAGNVLLTATKGEQIISSIYEENIFTLNLTTDGANANWVINARVDVEGNSQSSQFNLEVVIDSVEPQLIISNPTEATLNAEVVTVQGTATDNFSIENVAITNNRFPNQVFGIVWTENGNFSADIPLDSGNNQINITAIDSAKLFTVKSINVTKDDGMLPTLTISSHSSGGITNQAKIVIEGTVATSHPVTKVSVSLNTNLEANLTVIGSELYRVKFAEVELVEGDNVINIKAETPTGYDEQQLIIHYTGANDDIGSPVILIKEPSNSSFHNEASFILRGEVHSLAPPVNLVANGITLNLTSANTEQAYFQQLYSFSTANEALEISLVATDSLGNVSNKILNFAQDTSSPELVIENSLQPFPAENLINEIPYQFKGTVTDDNLASVLINDQPVKLVQTGVLNEFVFDESVSINNGESNYIVIEARDFAGNKTTREYSLLGEMGVDIDVLSPSITDEILVSGGTGEVQFIARLSGIESNHNIELQVNNQSSISVEQTSGLINRKITFSAEQENSIQLRIVDVTDNALVAQKRVPFNVINDSEVTMALVSSAPENMSINQDPNSFIQFSFNKPVDLTLLNITVKETYNGETYIDRSVLGENFLNAKGYQLEEVHLNMAPVEGSLSILPDDKTVAFYPKVDLAYGGQVFVDVKYEGVELARFSYNVRSLPTFIDGGVYDQLGQPVVGIEVYLPSMARTEVTNTDGAFAFGYGDSAEEALLPGMTEIVVNPNMKNPAFGSIRKRINVKQGKLNSLRVLQIPVLNVESTFHPISSGQPDVRLAKSELILDLTDASLTFPNGKSSGSVHVSFLKTGDMNLDYMTGAMPYWLYSIQPVGIDVKGQVGIEIKMPKLFDTYDYLPDEGEYLVLLGRERDSDALKPIGVAKLDGYRVKSEGDVHLQSMDVISISLVSDDQQALLKQYANGDLSLQALIGSLLQ